MLLSVAVVFMAIWLLGVTALQRPPQFIHAAVVIAIGFAAAHFYLQRQAHEIADHRPEEQRSKSSLLRDE